MLGCIVAAVGFYLWGDALTGLDLDSQWYYIALAGAGLGLVLGPVSTDALNRAPDAGYGEVTGITQTVRNLGASLGLAVTGSIFIHQNVDRVESTLTEHGVPAAAAERIAHAATSSGGGEAGAGMAAQAGSAVEAIMAAVRVDVAHSTQVVVWIMAGVMAAAFVVAGLWLPKGHPEEQHEDTGAELTPA